MVEPKPKVFIVDDDESVRRGLMITCKSEGLEAEAFSSAFAFLSEYDPRQPGCLILDIRMAEMDGISLQKKLLQRRMSIPVIMISGHASIPMAVEAIKLGAVDFLEKPFGNDDILKIIQEAFSRDFQIRQEQAFLAQGREGFDRLSGREREILRYIYKGFHNKAIAQELGISHKTIEFHRKNIMVKMQAESLVELIQMLDTLAPTQN